MNKAFENISLIQGMIAASLVAEDGTLSGWCANSAISPDNLRFIGETCRVILSASRAEQRAANLGAVAFGNRTLVFRESRAGLFLAYLDSPTNEAVLSWLFEQVEPMLAEEGVEFVGTQETA
jgi:hypothetical protein